MSDENREAATPAGATYREALDIYARAYPGGPPVVPLDVTGRVHEGISAVLRRLGSLAA